MWMEEKNWIIGPVKIVFTKVAVGKLNSPLKEIPTKKKPSHFQFRFGNIQGRLPWNGCETIVPHSGIKLRTTPPRAQLPSF